MTTTHDDELRESIKSIFDRNRIPYEGVYEPRAIEELMELFKSQQQENEGKNL